MPYGSPRRKVRQRVKEDLKKSPKLPKFNVRHYYTCQILQTPTRINKKTVRASAHHNQTIEKLDKEILESNKS